MLIHAVTKAASHRPWGYVSVRVDWLIVLVEEIDALECFTAAWGEPGRYSKLRSVNRRRYSGPCASKPEHRWAGGDDCFQPTRVDFEGRLAGVSHVSSGTAQRKRRPQRLDDRGAEFLSLVRRSPVALRHVDPTAAAVSLVGGDRDGAVLKQIEAT